MRDLIVETVGDRGIRLRFDRDPSLELTEILCGIAAAARSDPRVFEAVPGTRSVLIETSDVGGLKEALVDLVAEATPLTGKTHAIEARYDGADLEWALETLRLSRSELIEIHSGREYRVRMIGSPGFIYLSDVDPTLRLPRLDTPRRHVAAGSIGIAGLQTGIYGRDRPGGWRLIGSTDIVPRLEPGDRVVFTPL